MLLDLKDLSLRTGEHYQCSFPLEMAPVTLGGARYQVVAAQGVTVAVDCVAGGFLVGVLFGAKVYGPCARCLREAVVDVRPEQQEFVPTAKDGWEESDLSAFVTDMVVDAAGIAQEALVLALPSQILCSPSCAGLCPLCGKDLNLESCGCASVESDERWKKLKDLKPKNGDGP